MRRFSLIAVVVGVLSGCPSDPPLPAPVLGELSGRVVLDGAGGPTAVAGARVEVSGARLAVLAGADGRFKFQGFSAGSYVLRLSDGANASVVSTSLAAVEGGAASRDLGDVAIGRRSSLTVRLVDGGAPVRGATVVVEPEWARGVDASGVAVFDDVPGGSWAVVATRVEGESLRTVRATVDVPVGGDAAQTLDLATGTLSGPGDVVVPVERVGGEGEARIRLESQGHPAVEHAVDGSRTRVPRVAPGIYTVMVEGDGFASAGFPLVVIAGETELPTVRLASADVLAACGPACAVDPCAEAGCGPSSTCEAVGGRARCGCVAGFGDPSAVAGSGPPWACANVDECDAGTHDCGANSLCSDTDGAFACTCASGFEGDGTGRGCVDVDECEDGLDDCHANATCTNTAGGFTCGCRDGYAGDGAACVDVDECADGLDDCDANATCSNTAGGFSCDCDAGYVGDGTACTEVDECADASHDCGPDSTCTNTDGSFTCACASGYAGDASGRNCVNVDECAGPGHDCGPNSLCSDTVGAFSCACVAGYAGDATGRSCVNVDECAAGTHDCGANSLCSDTVGAFTCACAAGYVGDASGRGCVNVDECAAGTHDCGANSLCSDSVGAFTCACAPGYAGDATGRSCVDVDECPTAQNDCGSNSTCSNTEGSFTCACDAGYRGSPAGRGCADVDECTADIDDCGAGSNCENTIGSFTCACRPGFSGDATGRSCVDVNECATATDDCGANSQCSNTSGSFTCACAPGFVGNASGRACVDVDECAASTHTCGANSNCSNTAGGYTCACVVGFAGDATGRNCRDPNAPYTPACGAGGWCPVFPSAAGAANFWSIRGFGSQVWVADDQFTVLRIDGGVTTVTDKASVSGRSKLFVASETVAWHGLDSEAANAPPERWNGSAWAVDATAPTDAATISGSGPNDIWVGGANGKIDHYDGTQWVNERAASTGQPRIRQLASDGTSVYAVAVSNTNVTTLYRKNGAAWDVVPSPAFSSSREFVSAIALVEGVPHLGTNFEPLTAGTTPNRGTLRVWNGTGWDRYDAPGRPVVDLQVRGNELWGVTEVGSVFRFVAGVFTFLPALGRDARSLYVPPTGGPWVAGSQGLLTRWTGSAWSGQPWRRSVVSAAWPDSGGAWSVGTGGSIDRLTGTAWAPATAQTGADLLRVHASGPGDGWATGANRVLQRWEGSSWSTPPTPTLGATQDVLGPVWTFGTESWVGPLGAKETHRWNGSAWAEQSAGKPGTAFGGTLFWGHSPTHLWLLGTSSMIWWNGATWASRASPGTPASAWASSPTDLWIGGTNRGLWRCTTANCSTIDSTSSGTALAALVPSSTATITGLWGTASNDVYATASTGEVLRFDGTAWSLFGKPTQRRLNAITGTSGSDLWVLGEGRFHWNGTRWAAQDVPLPDFGDILGVDVAADGTAWAVGTGGTILRRSPAGVVSVEDGQVPYTTSTASDLNAISVSGAHAWVVGNTGVATRFDGSTWTRTTTGTTRALNAVLGDASDAWAVGDTGTIVRWNGTQWTAVATTGLTGTPNLESITRLQDGTVLVAGSGPTMARWSGSAWVPETLPFGAGSSVTAVRVIPGTNEAFACGDGRRMARRSAAGAWTLVSGLPTAFGSFRALAVRSATQAWVITEFADVLTYGGTSWTKRTLPAPATNSISLAVQASPSTAAPIVGTGTFGLYTIP